MQFESFKLSREERLMKLVTGAVLLLAAVQAYAHAISTPFPNQAQASDVFTPASLVLTVLGLIYLVWGTLSAVHSQSSKQSE